MIIGISGHIGSGKDLIGKIIQYLLLKKENKDSIWSKDAYFGDHPTAAQWLDTYSDWKIKKFADKLKDITCLLLGVTREQLEDREFKETPLEKEWWYYKGRHGTLIPYHSESTRSSEDLIKLTPRRLMQLLGTDAGRNIIHPNLWVNATMSEYKPQHFRTVKTDGVFSHQELMYPKWIISDVRFPNEAKAIKDRNGILIRLDRNTGLESMHESETALDNYNDWDYIIENNGTIEELIEKVKEILIKEHIIWNQEL